MNKKIIEKFTGIDDRLKYVERILDLFVQEDLARKKARMLNPIDSFEDLFPEERFENIESELSRITEVMNKINFGEKLNGKVFSVSHTTKEIADKFRTKISDSDLFKEFTNMNMGKAWADKPDQAEDLRKIVASKKGGDIKHLNHVNKILDKHEQDQYFIPFAGKVEEEFIDIKINDDLTPLENIDISITSPDKPEIIGDYMHYRGEDYYKVKGDCSNCIGYKDSEYPCCKCKIKGESSWKNIKEIDITDDIAILRPWVICENIIFRLWGKDLFDMLIVQQKKMKGSLYYVSPKHTMIATVSDLKKAGIAE
jgi:hypothetical protein